MLAFGLGTGHDFTTFGLIPTALVITTVLDGLLRASYDVISREALHVLGVRRRAIVVGEGEHLDHLLRTLGSVRGGIDYDFVGVVSGDADRRRATCRGSARFDDLRAVLDRAPGRRADRHRLGLQRARPAPDRRGRAPVGVKVRVAPKTTELLVQRGEYVPGQGVPLFELRPPVFAGTDWAIKRAFDLAVSALVDRRRAAALARDRGG